MSVYASADWHGCGTLAEKVLDFLQPEDTLYFIGDAIDRGPDGIKIFNKLALDKRVIMLKGNHEEFLQKLVPFFVEGIFNDYSWFSNGGIVTWDSMSHMSDDSKMWYVRKINTMPTEAIYHSPKGHDVILEHAGFSPFIHQTRTHHPLWDRDHFYDEWSDGSNYKDLDPEKTYLVHGHTPVQYLELSCGYKGQSLQTKEMMEYARQWYDFGSSDWKPEVIRYCDDHKFDVDMCTISSDRIALLDLDNFKTIYFDIKQEENK